MKNISTKTIAILFFVAAVCLYIASAIGFLTDGSMAVVNLCTGSLFLCLGIATAVRAKKEEQKADSEK